MRMRITAPCTVNGAPQDIGETVDVTEAGEIHRLTHYGQAVPAEDETEDAAEQEAVPAEDEGPQTDADTEE